MPKPTFFNLPDDKRDHIIDVAVDEFASAPYDKVSITRIVTRAGIAKGSFYQYFDGKVDLFRYLIFTHITAKKVEYLSTHGPPAASDFFGVMEHMSLAALEFGLTNPRLSRLATSIMHAPNHPDLRPLYDELQRVAHRSMLLILTKGQAEGQIRTDLDLDLAADLLQSVMQTGLDAATMRHLGVDMIEFCSRPDLGERFGEAERRAVVHGVMDFLRRGLAVQGAGAAMTSGDLIEAAQDNLRQLIGDES